MLKELDDYDWECAFGFSRPNLVIGSDCSNDSFEREDVKEIIAIYDGYPDGDSWHGLFLLNDKRYAYVTAWCNYTGWDWQSGGHSLVSDDLNNMIQFGLTDEARRFLNLEIK